LSNQWEVTSGWVETATSERAGFPYAPAMCSSFLRCGCTLVYQSGSCAVDARQMLAIQGDIFWRWTPEKAFKSWTRSVSILGFRAVAIRCRISPLCHLCTWFLKKGTSVNSPNVEIHRSYSSSDPCWSNKTPSPTRGRASFFDLSLVIDQSHVH